MKVQSNHLDLVNLGGILAFKLVLEAIYILFVQPLFVSNRFILEFSPYKYLLGIFLLVLMYFLMPRDQRPASVILQIHLLLIFLPMLSYYSLTDSSMRFMGWSIAAFLLECILVRVIPPLRILRIANSRRILLVLIALMTVAVYAVMIPANGISLGALNFDNTYDIRETIRFPLGMGYLVPWQSKVINPFLIALGFKQKKKSLLGLGIGLQLLLFFITAQKAMLFIPVAILGVMWFMEHFDFLPSAALIAPLYAAGNLAVYVYTGNIYIPSLFIRRLLFLPAQLKFFWYEFFTFNPKLYYSQGTIGRILNIPNPYPTDAAKVIGDTFFNKPDMHANAGYVADAYANGGLIGLVAIAVVFALILVLINSLSQSLGQDFIIGMAMFHIISLNDGGLVTGLVTGGLLFLLLILYLYSSETEEGLSKTR